MITDRVLLKCLSLPPDCLTDNDMQSLALLVGHSESQIFPLIGRREQVQKLFKYLSCARQEGRKELVFSAVEYIWTQVEERMDDMSVIRSTTVLRRVMAVEGYEFANFQLIKSAPAAIMQSDLHDRITQMLGDCGFIVTRGHYQQSINAFVRGEWESANAQIRSFCESLVMELLDATPNTNGPAPPDFVGRCNRLATLSSPLLYESLGEVSALSTERGKSFVGGLWKRLHASGSHPGQSDMADSQFRLSLVSVFARLLLDRHVATRSALL